MPFNSIWYASLIKSPLNPPMWVFGPAWTILYTLMTIALILVIRESAKDKTKKPTVRYGTKVFAFQLFFNLIWSPIFFRFERPDLALIDLIVMLVGIIWTIVVFKKVSKTAAWLLLPYLAWVTFAGYLNLSVVLLN